MNLPIEPCIEGKMIGHVSAVKCILNHRAVFYHDVALIQNPVDMISVGDPCESMMGSPKGR